MTHAIRVHGYGGPEVLRWEPVIVRAPRDGEVRIRHRAIGLNFVEVLQRTGSFPFRLPFIPGNEGVGIVEEVGENVSEVQVGDRVAYAPVPGSYSEVRIIASDRLVRLPNGIDDRTAAAIMLQGMTAQYLLRQICRIGPEDVVLVHAAAGGVGLFLCQWAAALGATVLGTVSTERKAMLAHQNGCHHPIVYTAIDVAAEVRRLTGGAMATVVYDAVGRDIIRASLDSVRSRGHIVSYGNSSGPIPPLDVEILGRKGSLTLTRGTLATFTQSREDMLACAKDVFDIVLSREVKVNINQSFDLREAAAAHRALEGRQTTGSTILLP